MAEENKLAEVNATLDRFAKLIEENAQQSRKDKAEYDRQREDDRAKDEKRQADWEKRQADWERRDAELGKKVAAISDQVGGQGNSIGEITEAMTVSDNILNLINKFEGIDVAYFSFNISRKYPAKNSRGKTIRKQHEIDGLADGEKVAVVIEAKTILTKEHVTHFLDKLAKFKIAYPDHAHKDVYGALTFIRMDENAHQLAEQHGLFILRASPPNVELANHDGFKPTKVS